MPAAVCYQKNLLATFPEVQPSGGTHVSRAYLDGSYRAATVCRIMEMKHHHRVGENAITEAYYEPLSKEEVTTIASLFLA